MPNLFEVIRQPGDLAATAAGGEALNNLLQENNEQPVLLLLSAGSALGLLDYISSKTLGENLTVAMLDERFSTDEKINNFAGLQKTDFYARAIETNVSFFGSLPRPGETITDVAKRMEKNLLVWKTKNPQGIIIATLGLGRDGHTAGIFPFSDDADEFQRLFEKDNWITAYDVGQKHQYNLRVTTTAIFFKKIDYGIAFVCGQNKKEKLDELIKNQSPAHKLPAQLWHSIKNLKIFTDLE